ncbi:MAG: hypothetical protein HY674_09340 [Chloroflexi bacterium]|nr:hypothetical protein [Chloroflexota bacterium]
MNTESTDDTNKATVRGWVLYDGACSPCTTLARRFEPSLLRRGFRLGCGTIASQEMVLLTADGQRFGGAEAIVQLARHIWWSWPVFALGQLPGATFMLRALSRRVAAHRHASNQACRQRRRRSITTTFFEMP